MKDISKNPQQTNNILVIGGTGKTGRRVVERLKTRGLPVRIGSRVGEPPFDWEDPTTWEAVLQGMTHVYVTFYPDLGVPGSIDAIRTFTDLTVQSGVKRLVLLSGRGEEEAQKCEQIVQQSGIEWTILRATWFCQNFSEGYLRELMLSGQVALPVGTVGEPFIDVEDIADIAVAALTEDRHVGQVYELTGPRLLTFAEAINEINSVTGHKVKYIQISDDAFTSGLAAEGVPADAIALMSYLFATVLDGRNEHISDGVQRALGRQPRDFTDYVQQAVAAGAWQETVVRHS